jgi:transposase
MDGSLASAFFATRAWGGSLNAKRTLGYRTVGRLLETPAPSFGAAPANLAPSKRGLQGGLRSRVRTLLLMLDETIVTETPPLYSCYGRRGKQVEVPISGSRAKRILHGAINVHSGEVLLLITHEWVQETHQAFLRMIRKHWRGWNLILFEDRGSPHTAEDSRTLAHRLNIELRWLPKATPELNAMDQLWRHVKRDALADRTTATIDRSADQACQYLLTMSRQERLRKAGILSGNFWLAKWAELSKNFL